MKNFTAQYSYKSWQITIKDGKNETILITSNFDVENLKAQIALILTSSDKTSKRKIATDEIEIDFLDEIIMPISRPIPQIEDKPIKRKIKLIRSKDSWLVEAFDEYWNKIQSFENFEISHIKTQLIQRLTKKLRIWNKFAELKPDDIELEIDDRLQTAWRPLSKEKREKPKLAIKLVVDKQNDCAILFDEVWLKIATFPRIDLTEIKIFCVKLINKHYDILIIAERLWLLSLIDFEKFSMVDFQFIKNIIDKIDKVGGYLASPIKGIKPLMPITVDDIELEIDEIKMT